MQVVAGLDVGIANTGMFTMSVEQQLWARRPE